jgi:diguanylate cyclase (GGDEF)-like protein/PAS domain S-box-containing protein
MNTGTGVPARPARDSPEMAHGLSASRGQAPGETQEAEGRALLRALIDQVPDLLFVKDVNSRFLLANVATARDVGQMTPDALIGRTDLDFHEESLARKYLRQERDIMFAGMPFLDVEERAWHEPGQKWYSVTKLPLRNTAGEVIGLVGCCRDITERKREERLHQGGAAILERIADGTDLDATLDTLLRLVEAECSAIKASILLADEDGTHLFGSTAPSLSSDWLALTRELPIAEGFGSCGTAAFRREAVIVTDIESDPLWRGGRDAIRPFGLKACWSWPIVSADGTILGTSAMYCAEARGPSTLERHLADFTTHVASLVIQRKQAEERIRFLAQNDALTGLPNRAQLEPIIDHALRNARQAQSDLAVVFIDIDGFKNVNDGLGHRAGDGVLKVVAGRLLSMLGPRETAARFGGDEFVVLLREAGLESEPETGTTLARVAALRAAVGAPIAIDGRTFHLTTSMGVAHYPRDGMTAEALIANADAALFRAKEFGRDNVQLFTSEMKLGLEGRLFRQEEMRRGLREEEFLLHYQPQVSLATGQVVGVEALVRWLHPTLGLLSPGEFIPLAEQTGLIVRLGDWVGQVAAALAENDLDPHWLELELTESLIMQDPRKAVVTMQALRDLGVQIAIDDFGTGYSNLSSLNTFPISRLKIDQSFVRGLPAALGSSAITGAVISLGNQLGLTVIAEGVETAAQMDFLRDHGCDAVQGYLVGRPMTAQAVEARLA